MSDQVRARADAYLVTENPRIRSGLRHHLPGPGKVKHGTFYFRSDVSAALDMSPACRATSCRAAAQGQQARAPLLPPSTPTTHLALAATAILAATLAATLAAAACAAPVKL